MRQAVRRPSRPELGDIPGLDTPYILEVPTNNRGWSARFPGIG